MRNLKKILALALALVMTLSLMTVANAFNDDADISDAYSEAVTVLSNLEVFKGVNDGSNFAPKQTISRGEVAAIIYRIVTGDVDDANIAQHAAYAETVFDDVDATDWDAGYIGYCANAEIIVGDGTNFYPRQEVNGYQALAMILRAIGYDANDEFQGDGWEIRTASTAQQLGLLRNIGASSLNGAATREMVAEILFRTIAEAYIVQYTTAFGYQPVYLPASENDPGSSTIPLFGNVVTATLGFRTFGLRQTTGVISAVGRTAGTTTLGSTRVTGTDTPWTDIGYAAYVYTVPGTTTSVRAAVSDVVITGESLAVSTDGTDFTTLTNSSRAIVGLDNSVTYYYNGDPVWDASTGVVASDPSADDARTAVDTRGVKVDFIDNDNSGSADVVVVTEYTAAQVSAVTTDTTTTGTQGNRETTTYLQYGATYTNAAAVRASALVTSDTLAVGDWVTYVEYAGDYYVTEAPATTGRYTARNVAANVEDTYTIGGTNYYVSGLEYITGGAGQASAYLRAKARNTDVTIYTDPYGYIIQAQDAAVNYSYLYVISNEHTEANTGRTEAVVALTDGSVATVYVTNVAGSSLFTDNALAGAMYPYTVNSNGTYTLYTATTFMEDASYSDNRAFITGTVGANITTVGVDNATVLVDLRGVLAGTATAGTVYTGYANIPSMDLADLWYTTATNSAGETITYAFLVSNVNNEQFIVYQTTNYALTAGGYTMDVIIDGVIVEDYVLTTAQWTEIQRRGVGLYWFSASGDYMSYSAFNEVAGTVAAWANNAITVAYNDHPYWPVSTDYYTYSASTPITVLTIGDGAQDFAPITGRSYYVYVDSANGISADHIYVIVDNEPIATPTNNYVDADGTTWATFTEAYGIYNYTYAVYKTRNTEDVTVCIGRELIVEQTLPEQALELVDGNATDGYVLKDGVTLEEAEDLLADAQAVANNPNSTQLDGDDARAAIAILQDAIDAYNEAAGDLRDAKDYALDALFDVYRTLDTAERRAAVDDYDTACEAIEAATSEAEVNAALAAGVLAVKACDESENEPADLAGALYTAMTAAGQSLNDVVAGLLADEWTVDQIRSGLSSGAAQVHGDVVPALVANDVSVEDIFEGYEDSNIDAGASSTRWINHIVGDLVGADVEPEEIIAGYFAYIIGADGHLTDDDTRADAWDGVTFSYNSTSHTLTLEVETFTTTNYSFGLSDLLFGLGFGGTSEMSWVSTNVDVEGAVYEHDEDCNDHSAGDHDPNTFLTDVVSAISQLDIGDWEITTEIDDIEYTIRIVSAD